MECRKISALLSPYIDQMTDEHENALVEAHLRTCPRCRQKFQQLQMLCAAMRKMEEPELPRNLWKDLCSRLNLKKIPGFPGKDQAN